MGVTEHTWRHLAERSSLTCYFSLVDIPRKKSKKLMIYLQRCWRSELPEIWLSDNNLAYNLWDRIFSDMEFMYKNRIVMSFIYVNSSKNIMASFYENSKKLRFGPILASFYPFKKNKSMLLTLFFMSRFLLLWLCCRSSEKKQWTDSDQDWLQVYSQEDGQKHGQECHRTSLSLSLSLSLWGSKKPKNKMNTTWINSKTLDRLFPHTNK